MQEPLAFLDGRWIPACAAAVPVDDAGFVLGVTVAEQLRTFGGKLFRLDDHLARLAHSLEIIGIAPGMTRDELARTAEKLVANNHPLLPAGDDMGLSIVVTPGSYPTFTSGNPRPPTVCMHTYRLPFHQWAEKYREGQSLVTTPVQQVPGDCWPPSLKCRSRMHYYLADRQARAIDPSARALLLDAQGFVTEASSASLLIYRTGEGLLSPPAAKILPGISLSVTLELAHEAGVATGHRDLRPEDVATADEALLTSTSVCLLPVTRFNGRPVGAGRPGPIFSRLMAAWSKMAGVDIVAQACRERSP